MNKWVTMVSGVLLGLILAQFITSFITSQMGASVDAVTALLVWVVSVFCGGVLGYDYGETGTIGGSRIT